MQWQLSCLTNPIRSVSVNVVWSQLFRCVPLSAGIRCPGYPGVGLIPSSIEGDSFKGFPSGKKSESMRRTDTEVRHGQSGCVTGRF